ncbi:atypical dual specificity phosphatase [Mytilus galloprovincialis]|uniref:Atypical dual specificity phosphatase n=1 Tax=Mytilus galloprovincialis TaxID=29158 RepID=A0A8B6EHP0_MYTGA|nr:atypical dual specificity phosphatase [Mytilus galloprovincialis]
MPFLADLAKITEWLYLCGASGVTIEKLRDAGITEVINCTLDVPNVDLPEIKTTRIRIDDSPHAPLQKHFESVADHIESVRSNGGKILVHCVAGVSRSVTLCIAYLMKYQKLTLFKAHEEVIKRRPIIRPNMGFWEQMIEYEKVLHGKNTVEMVQSPIGFIPDIYQEQTRNMWAFI